MEKDGESGFDVFLGFFDIIFVCVSLFVFRMKNDEKNEKYKIFVNLI